MPRRKHLKSSVRSKDCVFNYLNSARNNFKTFGLKVGSVNFQVHETLLQAQKATQAQEDALAAQLRSITPVSTSGGRRGDGVD